MVQRIVAQCGFPTTASFFVATHSHQGNGLAVIQGSDAARVLARNRFRVLDHLKNVSISSQQAQKLRLYSNRILLSRGILDNAVGDLSSFIDAACQKQQPSQVGFRELIERKQLTGLPAYANCFINFANLKQRQYQIVSCGHQFWLNVQ